MKNQTKVLVITVIIIVVVLGVIQFALRGQSSLTVPNFQPRNVSAPEEVTESPSEQIKKQEIMIDFGGGQKISGEAATQSAYLALVKVARDNNLVVEVKEYKYGLMVTKIGSKANNQDFAWMYLVNGKPGQIASDRYLIYPGDNVEWVYKKINQ